MTWLVTHMYAVLAATGGAALLLGWAVRGAFARARIDKVIGERRILQADLDGSKEEIERLYTAQRRASLEAASNPADPAVRAELDAREKRIGELTSDVNRLKSELTAARTSKGGGAAPAPVPASATAGEGEEPTLIWRNRHLESRIKHLESAATTPTETAPIAAAPVVDLAPESVANEADPVAAEKLKWRLAYLAARATALEDELGSVRIADVVPATVAAPVADIAVPAEAAGLNDQEELARLRWRNRFLEGRLAYFEGEKSEAAPVAAPSAPAPHVTTAAASVAAAAVAVAPPAPPIVAPPPVVPAPEKKADAPLASALLGHLERADAELDAAEAATAAPVIEKVKPPTLKAAVGGKADDLTAIGGIGPKIQDVLFKLGIYHFDQIAAWTPQNVAWVNQHLDFEGRIQREGWVEQAAVLAG